MTIDEAIQHCEEVADTPCFTDEEARCYSEHRQLAEWLKELKAYKEQSGDAISRAKVEEITWGVPIYADAFNVLAEVRDKVRALPPVTPQQRTGQWIEHFDESGKWYECDQCHTDWGGAVNYCPNCGAKMEVEE